jgi:sec-independent protein translocase protein TatA
MLRDAPAPVARPPPYGYRSSGIASPATTIRGPTFPRNQSCDRSGINRQTAAAPGIRLHPLLYRAMSCSTGTGAGAGKVPRVFGGVMGSFSIWHWMVVLLVVLLLFGGGKVSSLMGDFAKGIKSFKKNMAEPDDASMEASEDKPTSTIAGPGGQANAASSREHTAAR